MTEQKFLENGRVLPKVEDHLKDAPYKLAEYVLNSWFLQYQDGQAGLFYFRDRPKEDRGFWNSISHEKWYSALQIAQKNNWWEEKEYTKESEFDQLDRMVKDHEKAIVDIYETLELIGKESKPTEPTEPTEEKPNWLNPPLKVGDKVLILEWWTRFVRDSKYERVFEVKNVFDTLKTEACMYETTESVYFCNKIKNRDKWVKL